MACSLESSLLTPKILSQLTSNYFQKKYSEQLIQLQINLKITGEYV